MARRAATKKTPERPPFPNTIWFPAFCLGLSIGILIHFLPGMDRVLEGARREQKITHIQAPRQVPRTPWRPPPSRRSNAWTP